METLRTGCQWFSVDDASATGSIRRAAVRLAQSLGFGEARTGEAAIVASEIAGNAWLHAPGGAVALQVALRDGVAGVRVVSSDDGPGMVDLDVSSTDGHSTTGTLGLGLGAIGRLSSVVDVSTQPGHGTVLVADLWPEQPAPERIDVAGLTRPIGGEEQCGDAVAGFESDGTHLLLVSDGLGHGALAAAASLEAVDAFHKAGITEPGALLTVLHQRLSGTRGAAAAVAAIDPDFSTVRFAGVGNISAFVDDGERRHALLSAPGIVGHRMAGVRTTELPLGAESVLVMHSDGVRETWDLRAVPGLGRRSSPVIAASVFRVAATRRDDASVVVVRTR
ncbi:MAG: hypothetical protein QOE97_192 [Pseudonocardiales bacterium]|nr:hypothetical protein [Pseudonocardiales bacterium]